MPASAFYRLSEELLTAIVDSLGDYMPYPDHNHCCPRDLGTLRLVHPRFAYLRRINQTLFHTLKFSPKPSHRPRLDWTQLGPWVQAVEFHPEDFYAGSMVVWELLQESGVPQTSENQTRLHHRLFQESRDYVKTGQAVVEWTEALRNLTHLRRVVIHDRLVDGPGDVVPAKNGGILSLAVQVLRAAGTRVQELEISGGYSRFDWTKHRWWQTLDLSGLTSLRISHSAHIPASELHQALVTCSNTLETLEFIGCCAMQFFWPNSHPPPLPSLRELAVRDGGVVNAQNFGLWLHLCPRIEELRVTDVQLDYELNVEEWLPILNAIRHHPMRMHVRLDMLELGNHHRLCVDHHTGLGPADESVTSELELQPLIRFLEAYMSGSTAWDEDWEQLIDWPSLWAEPAEEDSDESS
jgi:hypothetical protein